MSCSRGPEECLGPWPSWDRHTADRTRYFLRWGGWELLLLVGAGVTPESLGAGLCFSSLAAGQDLEGWCPSRACTTLMVPTVRMRPQSRVGASRGDSCLRTQCRAWVRMLLELRARGGLLSCWGRIEEGPWGSYLWVEVSPATSHSLANAFLPGGQTA